MREEEEEDEDNEDGEFLEDYDKDANNNKGPQLILILTSKETKRVPVTRKKKGSKLY
jgi:hypothetical protein